MIRRNVLRIFLIIMTLCVALSMAACHDTDNDGSGDNNATYSLGLAYGKDSGGQSYFVEGIGVCTDTEVIIPDKYEGLPVTAIGDSAFLDCDTITKIVIPSSVTAINDSAFTGCSSLTAVDIPNSVTKLGSSLFSGCKSLESLTIPFVGNKPDAKNASKNTLFGALFGTEDYDGANGTVQSHSSNGTETYYVPSSLTNVSVTGGKLHYGAFSNCTSITNITLGENVTAIDEYAFFGCSALKNINIPSAITEIGKYAFYDCKALTSLELPSGLAAIGELAFFNCGALESIDVASGNTHYRSEENCLIENSTNTIILGSINSTVPSSATSIAAYAFSGSAIASLNIPSTITEIGESAFTGCASLNSITIPFVGGSNATEASASTLFGYIFGSKPFEGGALTHQPYELTESENYYIPASLKTVTITGGALLYGSFYNCSNITKIVIGDDITVMEEYAFFNCSSLTSITIGSGITEISGRAFYNGNSITELILSDNITSIGNYAFSGFSSITELVIGDGVENIGGYAFFECTSLTTLTIGKGVQKIGTAAFKNCTELSTVYWNAVNCYEITALSNQYPFVNDDKLSKIIIGDEVENLPKYAFAGLKALESVKIPASVKKIDNIVFAGDTALTSVTFENPAEWSCVDARISYSSERIFFETAKLSDPETAATYLRDTYRTHIWTRQYQEEVETED